MADIAGLQVVGFVNGGSANNGRDVTFTLRVSNGYREQDVTFFVAEDQLSIMLAHLITYGGMAQENRLAQAPADDTDRTFASGHALGLVNALPGRSAVDPSMALLTLQFDGGQGRKLSVYCATDVQGLGRLASACEQSAGLLYSGELGSPQR
jgi:hypothetical protein